LGAGFKRVGEMRLGSAAPSEWVRCLAAGSRGTPQAWLGGRTHRWAPGRCFVDRVSGTHRRRWTVVNSGTLGASDDSAVTTETAGSLVGAVTEGDAVADRIDW